MKNRSLIIGILAITLLSGIWSTPLFANSLIDSTKTLQLKKDAFFNAKSTYDDANEMYLEDDVATHIIRNTEAQNLLLSSLEGHLAYLNYLEDIINEAPLLTENKRSQITLLLTPYREQNEVVTETIKAIDPNEEEQFSLLEENQIIVNGMINSSRLFGNQIVVQIALFQFEKTLSDMNYFIDETEKAYIQTLSHYTESEQNNLSDAIATYRDNLNSSQISLSAIQQNYETLVENLSKDDMNTIENNPFSDFENSIQEAISPLKVNIIIQKSITSSTQETESQEDINETE